jgi:3-isopropylmalate dehydrogenase
MVHKTNVLPYADRLWARVFAEIAAASPDIETDYLHVGAACLHMVASPGRFDVVVTDNLFGDIIADLGAAVQGGSRLAASANLNPGRSGPSMFEPIHGSAPDIAGTGRADPTAAVLGLALMLEFLDELAAATGVRAAVRAHLRGRTGHKSTPEVGDRLVTWIENEAVAQIEEASGPLLASACSDRWR